MHDIFGFGRKLCEGLISLAYLGPQCQTQVENMQSNNMNFNNYSLGGS
jgi:hypothetical protein